MADPLSFHWVYYGDKQYGCVDYHGIKQIKYWQTVKLAKVLFQHLCLLRFVGGRLHAESRFHLSLWVHASVNTYSILSPSVYCSWKRLIRSPSGGSSKCYNPSCCKANWAVKLWTLLGNSLSTDSPKISPSSSFLFIQLAYSHYPFQACKQIQNAKIHIKVNT